MLITTEQGGETSEVELPLKACDDISFSQFEPPMNSSAARIENFKKTRALKCIDLDKIDDSEQLNLYGTFDSDENRRVEVRLVACDTSSSSSCVL